MSSSIEEARVMFSANATNEKDDAAIDEARARAVLISKRARTTCEQQRVGRKARSRSSSATFIQQAISQCVRVCFLLLSDMLIEQQASCLQQRLTTFLWLL